MANQSENKIQHWVPQCYLRQWCDAEIPKGYTPYVWLYSKDWATQKRKAPTFLRKMSYILLRCQTEFEIFSSKTDYPKLKPHIVRSLQKS
ncbi:hypothetical protein D3C75_1030470 [compost metagenome]